MSAPTNTADQQLARWERFRAGRNAALAADHGWLTLTSFQWLGSTPKPLELVPGFWSTDGISATLTAAAEDGLTFVSSGEPVIGTYSETLQDEESLNWVQYGGVDGTQVVVELAMRADKYAVRTRDNGSAVYTEFSGVPTYPFNPEWVISGRFEAYENPMEVPIGTANPLVDGVHVSVGEVVFHVPGIAHEVRLHAEAEKLGALNVTFHDETNGDTTDEWRKVFIPKPRPDGSVIIDFNRAINYPSAFTPYGTCPMPVRGNSIDVRVEAGEKLPAD